MFLIWHLTPVSVTQQAPPEEDLQAQRPKSLAKINFDTGAPKKKGESLGLLLEI